jgi:F-type H+-transporting ATPase subunit b
MKKILFALFAIVPLTLFANDANVETDILERTVNFFIFVAIIYYLLADKAKVFFTNRTNSIQSDLDKVQDLLKASKKSIVDAKIEVENARKIAIDLIESANSDVDNIKKKIEIAVEQEINFLSKSFNDKTELETKKVKKEVVQIVLNQLLSNDNIALTQQELTNIISKKVA